METRSHSGAHPKGKKKKKKNSVARSSPRHTREPTRSLGLARRGQLIILDVLRIANRIQGTSVPGPFSKRAPDRAALKDRHASSARTVRTGVPPLRVETVPP